MTTAEKLIIRDYLGRKKWYYLTGLLIHSGCMLGCWWSRTAMFIGLMMCSSVLLFYEINRGGNAMTRTLLSLPLNARQLGRSWRFATFVFPTLAGLVIVCLGAVAAAWFDAPYLTATRFLAIVVSETLLLGTLFYALTGIPAQQAGSVSPGQRVINGFFTILWGLCYFAVFYFPREFPVNAKDIGPFQWTLLILMTGATVAGWFQAPSMVIKRAGRAAPGKPANTELSGTLNTRQWEGFGGIPFFLSRFGRTQAIAIVSMISIFWIFLTFAGMMKGGRSQPPVGMFISFSCYFAIIVTLPQLRSLRSMPLSRTHLTHVMVFWPVLTATAAGFFMSVASALILHGPSPAASWISVIPTAVIATGVLPLLLRFGMRVWAASIAMMLPAIAGVLINEPFRKTLAQADTMVWLAVGCCVFLAIIWKMSYHLLGSPHPWRANAFKNAMAPQRMG